LRKSCVSLLWVCCELYISFLASSIFPSLFEYFIWFSVQVLMLFLTRFLDHLEKRTIEVSMERGRVNKMRRDPHVQAWKRRGDVTLWLDGAWNAVHQTLWCDLCKLFKNSESFSTLSTIFGWERDKLVAMEKYKFIFHWKFKVEPLC
jgi:hypothetical protein